MPKYISATLLFLFMAGAGSAGEWTSSGPFGGHFTKIAFDPFNAKVAYAAGIDIYRSNNGGRNWVRFPLQGSFHLQKGTGNLLIRSDLLYTSTDRGNTWQGAPYQYTFTGGDFEIHPMILSTQYRFDRNGFYVSRDSGQSWLNTRPVSTNCGSIVVHRSRPELIYIGTDENVYKSTNSGKSWKKQAQTSPGALICGSLSVDSGDPEILYVGTANAVLKSTNGGRTWKSGPCNCRPRRIVVGPQNSQTVYALDDRIHQSTDGGIHWYQLEDPVLPDQVLRPVTALQVNPQNGKFLLAAGKDAGIVASRDGGKNWLASNINIRSIGFWFVTAAPSSPRTFATRSNFHSLAYVMDTSTTNRWTALSDLQLWWRTKLQIHPTRPEIVAGIAYKYFVLTEDGGKTWSYLKPPFFGEEPLVVFDRNARNIVWAAQKGKGIARSTDLGKTWKLINSGLEELRIEALALNPVNGNHAVTASIGDVYETTDAGRNWKRIAVISGTETIRQIVFDPASPGRIYAGARTLDSGEPGFWKSTDMGRTWVLNGNGLSPTCCAGIQLDPTQPGKLYAFTYKDVYVSSDAGESWSVMEKTGLPESIWDLSFGHRLVAATNRGIYTFSP